MNQAPRRTHFDDHTWIQRESEKIVNVDRRSAPTTPRQQIIPNQPPRNGSSRSLVIFPFISSSSVFRSRKLTNNHHDRVLSVSGKLRCTRCNDELGKDLLPMDDYLHQITRCRTWFSHGD